MYLPGFDARWFDKLFENRRISTAMNTFLGHLFRHLLPYGVACTHPQLFEVIYFYLLLVSAYNENDPKKHKIIISNAGFYIIKNSNANYNNKTGNKIEPNWSMFKCFFWYLLNLFNWIFWCPIHSVQFIWTLVFFALNHSHILFIFVCEYFSIY